VLELGQRLRARQSGDDGQVPVLGLHRVDDGALLS
jgi:hypothetical protein